MSPSDEKFWTDLLMVLNHLSDDEKIKEDKEAVSAIIYLMAVLKARRNKTVAYGKTPIQHWNVSDMRR